MEQEKYDIITEFEALEQGTPVYILKKIVDVLKNIGESHPYGIDLGHITVGTFKQPPTVGERFIIQGTRLTQYLNTSPVIEIIDEETFRTKNSTYKLTKYEGNQG